MQKFLFSAVLLSLLLSIPAHAESYAKYFSVARTAAGDAIASATVTVYSAGTLDVSTIYSSAEGAAKGNPFLTDAQGNYDFYAVPGLYKIIITKVAVGTFTVDNLQIGSAVHAERHATAGADPIVPSGISGEHPDPQKIQVQDEGVTASTRSTLNLVQTGTVNPTVTDASGKAQVTLDVQSNSLTTTHLAADSVGASELANDAVVDANVAAGAAIAESKLALTYPTHSNATDPSAGQKQALAGTSGTPSTINRYVTSQDARNSDARTPTAHAASHAAAGGDEVTVSQSQIASKHAGTDLTADLEEESHASEHQNSGADEISVTGLSGELADAQKVAIQDSGAAVGTRPTINFVDGSGTTAVVTDDPANSRTTVRFNTLGNSNAEDLATACADGETIVAASGQMDCGAGGSGDHGALTGLADDDHTQYVAKDGRSGGQIVYGGLIATETLELWANAESGTTIYVDDGSITLASDDDVAFSEGIQLANTADPALASCIRIDSDRPFADKDCDEIKDAGEEYLDLTDHGALTGLSDDDHTGYALLAGRSGGQTLSGGTGSGENLYLGSTANATKGVIFAGTGVNSGQDLLAARLFVNPTTGKWAQIDVDSGGYVVLRGYGTDGFSGDPGFVNFRAAEIIAHDGGTTTDTAGFYTTGNLLGVASDWQVTWNSTTTDFYPGDTGLARSAAKVVKVTDASTGAGAIQTPTTDTPPTCVTATVGAIYFDTSEDKHFSCTDNTGVPAWEATGGGGSPAGGSDTQVQFNDGGTAFGGATSLTYDKVSGTTTTGTLVVNGSLTANSFEFSSAATTIDIATDGVAANRAPYTLTPTETIHPLNCEDPDGCVITISEVGTVAGQQLSIVNASVAAYALNIPAIANQQFVAEDRVLEPNSALDFFYISSQWSERQLDTNPTNDGSAGYSDYFPDAKPSTCYLCDEYTDASYSGTAQLGNSPTVSFKKGTLVLESAASASVARKALWYTPPAQDWSFTTVVTPHGDEVTTFAWPTSSVVALSVLETGTVATPTLLSALLYQRDSSTSTASKSCTATSYTSAWTCGGGNAMSGDQVYNVKQYLQARYVYSTKALSILQSFNGKDWVRIVSRTLGAHPVAVGLMVDQNSANSLFHAGFEYARLLTDAAGLAGSHGRSMSLGVHENNGLYREYLPNMKPDTCALCEDFEGNSELQAWRWGNQGSATITYSGEAAFLTGPSESTNLRGRWVTLPTGVDYSVYMNLNQFPTGVSGNVTSGLWWLETGTEATPTKMLVSGFRWNNTSAIQELAMYTKTSYSGAYSTVVGSNRNLGSTPINSGCLRADYVTSTKALSLYYAADCQTWAAYGTSYTFANDPISGGFYVDSNTGGTGNKISVPWWRLRTDSDGLAGLSGKVATLGAMGATGANVFVTANASSGTDPVADGTDDTLNYTGTFPINVTGDSTTDTLTYSLDYTSTLAGDPAMAANGWWPATTGIVFEGSAADTIEGLLTVANPTLADKTWTLPDTSGNIVTTGDSGTVTSTMITDDTIVGNDIAAAYAGRSLTETANVLDADVELYEHTKCINIESPTNADNLLFFRAERALTVTGIDCLVSSATSAQATVNECDGNGGTCAAIEATITCATTNTTEASTIDNAAVDAGDWVRIQVGTVSGTPAQLATCVTYTLND